MFEHCAEDSKRVRNVWLDLSLISGNRTHRWDNKGGSNWTVAVEVAPGVGLVQALNPTYASTRELVSRHPGR